MHCFCWALGFGCFATMEAGIMRGQAWIYGLCFLFLFFFLDRLGAFGCLLFFASGITTSAVFA